MHRQNRLQEKRLGPLSSERPHYRKGGRDPVQESQPRFPVHRLLGSGAGHAFGKADSPGPMSGCSLPSQPFPPGGAFPPIWWCLRGTCSLPLSPRWDSAEEVEETSEDCSSPRRAPGAPGVHGSSCPAGCPRATGIPAPGHTGSCRQAPGLPEQAQ